MNPVKPAKNRRPPDFGPSPKASPKAKAEAEANPLMLARERAAWAKGTAALTADRRALDVLQRALAAVQGRHIDPVEARSDLLLGHYSELPDPALRHLYERWLKGLDVKGAEMMLAFHTALKSSGMTPKELNSLPFFYAGAFFREGIPDHLLHVPRRRFSRTAVALLLNLHRRRPNGGVERFERPAFLDGQGKSLSADPEMTIYNPSAPFSFKGSEVMAVRVEPRHDEAASEVWFFHKTPGDGQTWALVPGSAKLSLQDPFVSRIHGQLVVGGVKVHLNKAGRIDNYWTEFYTTKDLRNFEYVGRGPDGMKDIRLIGLGRGRMKRIGVLGRPQGKLATDQGAPGGLGSISYMELKGLKDLTPDNLMHGKLLQDQLPGLEWWGANEMHQLPDGRLGVLGHVAIRERNDGSPDDPRHYYVASFILNPKTGEISDFQLLLERKDIEDMGSLPPEAYKKPDLKDVLFSGGIRGRKLYIGIGDVYSGIVTLDHDPFEMDPGEAPQGVEWTRLTDSTA